MREIKFRAWDRDRKEMLPIENLWVDFAKLGQEHIDRKRNLHSLILRQFTGLKDKNGKEIYEGDILQIGDIGKCVVEYGCFTIGRSESGVEHRTIGFSGNWEDGSETHCGLYEEKRMEVIGNIYENPELLKESD